MAYINEFGCLPTPFNLLRWVRNLLKCCCRETSTQNDKTNVPIDYEVSHECIRYNLVGNVVRIPLDCNAAD